MGQKLSSSLLCLATVVVTALSTPMLTRAGEVHQGLASWYGPGFSGNPTASGEIFNPNDLTAAHHTLPFGTRVRVTNVNNGRSVVVRINDRLGHGGRIIDLSSAAANVLGVINAGIAPVRLEILGR